LPLRDRRYAGAQQFEENAFAQGIALALEQRFDPRMPTPGLDRRSASLSALIPIRAPKGSNTLQRPCPGVGYIASVEDSLMITRGARPATIVCRHQTGARLIRAGLGPRCRGQTAA
jgi:hypothetical protein